MPAALTSLTRLKQRWATLVKATGSKLDKRRRLRRRTHGRVCAEELPDVAHDLRNVLLRILPWIDAHLGVRREFGTFHRNGVRVRRDIVREDEDRRFTV